MGPAAVGNQSLSLGEVDTFEMFKTDVLCYLAVSVMVINGNLQQFFNVISESCIDTNFGIIHKRNRNPIST